MLSCYTTCVSRSMYALWSGTPSMCSELKRVLAWSVFCLFLLFFLLQQSLLAETWAREGRMVTDRGGILKVQSFALNLSCPSSRQPKGLRQSSSFQVGMAINLEPGSMGLRLPNKGSSLPQRGLHSALEESADSINVYSSPRGPHHG